MDETGNRAAPAAESGGTAEGGHDGSVQECATAISQMRAGKSYSKCVMMNYGHLQTAVPLPRLFILYGQEFVG